MAINNIFDSQIFSPVDNVHPRLHAKYLDKDLGFRITKIENKLLQKYRAYDKQSDSSNKKKHYPGSQTWIGLHPQALQTTYNDIFRAFTYLKDFVDIKHVVDIGAGYGRVGLVMNSLFPNAHFTGYEIVKSRQQEGNRIFAKYGLTNCEMVNTNVLDENFETPEADVYFIYDFSEVEDIALILDAFKDRARNRQIFLMAHGERVEFLITKKYKDIWFAKDHFNAGDLKLYQSNQL